VKNRAVRQVVLTAIAAIVAGGFLTASLEAIQEAAAAKPQPRKGVVIRGCLTGSKLTHIDPQTQLPADLVLKLPDTLKVTSIRVIRDQVKALNGHQVEVTGALRGIPGMETGVLVVDSDNAKLYLGGGDPNLGSDLNVSRNEPPTIYAQMIKDVAETCLHQSK
jgi:hypothetical protein